MDEGLGCISFKGQVLGFGLQVSGFGHVTVTRRAVSFRAFGCTRQGTDAGLSEFPVGVPIGSIVSPFRGSYLRSHKVIQKRYYIGD